MRQRGGETITIPNNPDGDGEQRNVYLFPTMLDHYQIQLTRLLESERFGEAKQLIRFLLQCQGEEERHYEEWRSLLGWLEVAFPGEGDAPSGAEEDEDEHRLRSRALGAGKEDNADEDYIRQVLHIMRHHPLPEQQLLALERAVFLEGAEVDREIIGWLTEAERHPAAQFKALQCLRRRGAVGSVRLARMGETVDIELESVPLELDDYPAPIVEILRRVEAVSEVADPTLPHFARELWHEALKFLYGTQEYARIVEEGEEAVDSWAAALHLNLLLAAYGQADDEAVREAYGITEAMRFRYERACKAIRSVGAAQPGAPERP